MTWKISSSLNALWENERKLAELLAVDATYGEIAHTSKIWMLMASLVQILDKDSREEPGPFVAALETSGTIRIAVDSVSNLNLDVRTGAQFCYFLYNREIVMCLCDYLFFFSPFRLVHFLSIMPNSPSWKALPFLAITN